MYQSENLTEIAIAVAKAQGELSPATKNAQNPHLKNKYADIAAVWEAVRMVLPNHGLSVVQTMRPREDGKACVHTMLLHTSGQWIAGECVLPVPKQDPQGFGSAITYARRYSLSAILGVVSEEDDDGNGASLGDKKQPNKATGKAPDNGRPAGLATDDQVQKVQILMRELNFTDRDERINNINEWLAKGGKPPVASTKELSRELASALIKALEKKVSVPVGQDPFPPEQQVQ